MVFKIITINSKYKEKNAERNYERGYCVSVYKLAYFIGKLRSIMHYEDFRNNRLINQESSDNF
jgi:hypothetical protein